MPDANGAYLAPDNSGDQSAAVATKEKTRLSAQVRMPLDLYTQVEEVAKAADKTVGRYILEGIAKQFKFTLPTAAARGKKYASEEERKAAGKARKGERNELVKMLLKKYEEEQAAAANAA